MARFLKALMTMHEVTTWDIASALQKSQSHASQIVCGRRAPSKDKPINAPRTVRLVFASQ